MRMNRHRSDIMTCKIDRPVKAHFCQPDHSLENLQVMGIEKMHKECTKWRRERESYVFFTLKTYSKRTEPLRVIT